MAFKLKYEITQIKPNKFVGTLKNTGGFGDQGCTIYYPYLHAGGTTEYYSVACRHPFSSIADAEAACKKEIDRLALANYKHHIVKTGTHP